MTEDELKKWDYLSEWAGQKIFFYDPTDPYEFDATVEIEDIQSLVSEIRRLRGLIKERMLFIHSDHCSGRESPRCQCRNWFEENNLEFLFREFYPESWATKDWSYEEEKQGISVEAAKKLNEQADKVRYVLGQE